MKLTIVLLTAGFLHVYATAMSQNITFSGKNASLESVFLSIEKQTNFVFVYGGPVIKASKPVTISAKDMPLEEFLSSIFKNQSLQYTVDGKSILVSPKPAPPVEILTLRNDTLIDLKGRIVDEKGGPVNASIMIKGTRRGTVSGIDGVFTLNDVNKNAELVISATNVETVTYAVNGRTSLDIHVKTTPLSLNEVVVNKGYYTEKQRLSTGNVSKVTAKEIARQPVTSPLLALQGLLPGVDISPTGGTPGSAINIQIRGLNSLRLGSYGGADGNLPLYVIDGVPVISNPIESNSSSLTRDGFDPLNTIDPNNIESIQILKDADATAIYGSRGANGVVLITTKMAGKAGKLNVDMGYYRGFGSVPNRIELINTQQYVEMRKEAIRNDGPDAVANYEDPFWGPLLFPDLTVWDTTRYTDWQDMLLGNTSHINDANFNVSTGNATTTFSIGGSYHNESLLYPGDFGYNRYTGNLSLNHLSPDQKLAITFSGTFGANTHHIFESNQLYNYGINLPPTAPPLYDEHGALNWARNNFGTSTWNNPLSWIRPIQDASSYNFLANSTASYRLTSDIAIRLNAGFSKNDQQAVITDPISSKDPNISSAPKGMRNQRASSRISWTIEPQLNFERSYEGGHKVMALVGTSFQHASNATELYQGTGYTSDALLGTLAGAAKIMTATSTTQYRYAAVYGRLSYHYKDKYLVNLTGRRDGSSRFGPGKQYGNFGAVGLGWIFSEESFMRTVSPFISFGKIRLSYGVTGNDQIGDSRFLKTYQGAGTTYNGQLALVPTALFNPDYAWETTRKLEGALEIGLLKDRINIELAAYQNRSSNQLIEYQLPSIAGFQSVFTNFNATVQNRGIEIAASSRNIVTKVFRWTTSVNFTKASNELHDFPNIETSSYAQKLKIGSPITIQRGYHWTGVDPATGIHTFYDLTGDGQITWEDQDFIKSFVTNYFGGVMNSFNFKGLELSFLIHFADRTTNTSYVVVPGIRANQPIRVLNRWQKPGDITTIQRYTTTGDADIAYGNWKQSDGSIEDVSFWRLKTATISYSFQPEALSRMKLRALKVFLQGQNLFAHSSHDVWDPETIYGIPPLRVISGGIELKL